MISILCSFSAFCNYLFCIYVHDLTLRYLYEITKNYLKKILKLYTYTDIIIIGL